MKIKHLTLITLILLTVSLTALLSGCAVGDNALDGRNIVTFEMNGGILNYGTSSTDGRINYAYHPRTLIKDPTELPNYALTRNGYVFTGWYKTEECKPGDKWDFENNYFDEETLTLYAGWELEIKFTFSVNYLDGDSIVTIDKNKVEAGEKFEDWQRHANKRDGYTPIGYFSDPECTVPWDFDTVHPGGDADLDIPVYVGYIEGDWELVRDFAGLKKAVKNGNVYLMNDIDAGGEEFYISGTFNRIFEGNGYKIKNFTVNKSGTTFSPSSAIFQTLGEKADIRNVSFEDVTFKFFDIVDADAVKAKAAALAVGMTVGAKVTAVSVSGVFETDYDSSFDCLDDVFYYRDGDDISALDGVTDFTANITVNKQ